jgi:hypothetical protein
MSARSIINAAAGNADDKLYVDDVFSTTLYTGNGSIQTINNGIDLAGKGGLVWIKDRNSAKFHELFDTQRGALNSLVTNNTFAQTAPFPNTLTAFNSGGFSLGSEPEINANGGGFVSWTFRKAPKFFDVVTFTATRTADGTGWVGGPKTISHALGVKPGMVIWKAITGSSDWYVHHISQGANKRAFLNSYTGFVDAGTPLLTTSASNVVFENATCGIVSGGQTVTIVVYLFAHDDSPDSIIKCGSFMPSESGANVDLGWEPQWVLSRGSNTGYNWWITDTTRGMPVGVNDALLGAATSDAESVTSYNLLDPTSTGFFAKMGDVGQPCIYMAIRRPNKPPTTGADMFEPIAHMGTGSATRRSVGSLRGVDLAFNFRRGGGSGVSVFTRLLGDGARLKTNSNDVAQNQPNWLQFSQSSYGVTIGPDTEENLGSPYVSHLFKRAPGVFDVVCYSGNNDSFAPRQHSLGVVPELVITKKRSGSGTANDWWVIIPNKYGVLNSSGQLTNFTGSIGSKTHFNPAVDSSGTEYVSYLFASKAGISKVGTYTGNGSEQVIDCQFTTGARFVLIKRTDATGDWYVWDTSRGIVAAGDPHFVLNRANAEVTGYDSVDPHPTGFSVVQNSTTNINVNGGKYLFLAFA